MENKQDIIDKHPSICYNCTNARKPASDENQEIGWVGCAEYFRKENCDFVYGSEELGEGWVDLRSPIFGKKSGISTNLQLLTKGVTNCLSFDEKK